MPERLHTVSRTANGLDDGKSPVIQALAFARRQTFPLSAFHSPCASLRARSPHRPPCASLSPSQTRNPSNPPPQQSHHRVDNPHCPSTNRIPMGTRFKSSPPHELRFAAPWATCSPWRACRTRRRRLGVRPASESPSGARRDGELGQAAERFVPVRAAVRGQGR
jgi:hypothetical protein